MNRRRYLEWRKEKLIRQIQQQRLDLAENKTLWLEKTERIDRGWQTLFGLRKYLVVGSSVMALYGIRHPSKLIRWSRRAFWCLWHYPIDPENFFYQITLLISSILPSLCPVFHRNLFFLSMTAG
ncbi:cell division MukB family protein [Serratia plymuthica 4Rx13]|nr:cell division MukB family protein [Serratia plymuthica 4Rx13]